MPQFPSPGSGYHSAPLSADEKSRAETSFAPYVAEALVTRGSFRVSANAPEMADLFQRVARTVGDRLQRPVVSYANGREIVIAFAPEAAVLPDGGGPSIQS